MKILQLILIGFAFSAMDYSPLGFALVIVTILTGLEE